MPETFGFDPKVLSDNELFTKQTDLIRRKALVAYMGRGDAVAQLDLLIQAIDAERQERMFMERWRRSADSPIVVESDPALRDRENAVAESKIVRPRQPALSTRRAIRSATPILPDGV
jgi:hypothetical protein